MPRTLGSIDRLLPTHIIRQGILMKSLHAGLIEQENSMRIMSCSNAATPVWMRVAAALLIVSIVGCAGTGQMKPYESGPATFRSESGEPDPWAFLKMAVAENYVDMELFDQETGVAKQPDGPVLRSAGGGAVAGGVVGTLAGGALGAIYGFSCGPAFVVCVPILAVVGAVGGGVAGVVKGAEVGARNAARYAGDDSTDARKAQISSTKASDAQAALRFLDESLPALSPVPDRVKLLAAPTSEQAEYLIEFNRPAVRFLHFTEKSGLVSNKPEADHALFDISIRARVVRLSDHAVLDRRLTVEYVSISPEELAAPKTAATASAISAKLDAALDVCAARIASYWTIPAINTYDSQSASESASADAASQGTDDAVPKSNGSNATPAATRPDAKNSGSAAPESSGTRAAEPDLAAVELAHWDAVRNSRSDVELQAYLTQYPNGRFAALASARLAALQPVAPTPVTPVAASPEPIGILVITDGLTRIENTVRVTVVETNAEQTVYSTGDIIDKDGNILRLRVGNDVTTVVSGALWNVRSAAGMQGAANVRLGANIHGDVRWRVIAAQEGRFRVEADTYFTRIEGPTRLRYSGRWRLEYAHGGPLPESHSGHYRSTSLSGGADVFSAKLSTR